MSATAPRVVASSTLGAVRVLSTAPDPSDDPDPPLDDGRWLTVKEAAVELGVAERTVYHGARNGRIPSRKDAVGRTVVDVFAAGDMFARIPAASELGDPLVCERRELEALKLRLERERLEEALAKERQERGQREAEVRRQMLLVEREHESRRRQLEWELERQRVAEEQKLLAERRKFETVRAEVRERERLSMEDALRRNAEATDEALYDSACNKFERELVFAMVLVHGVTVAERVRTVVRYSVETHRATHDVQGMMAFVVAALANAW